MEVTCQITHQHTNYMSTCTTNVEVIYRGVGRHDNKIMNILKIARYSFITFLVAIIPVLI